MTQQNVLQIIEHHVANSVRVLAIRYFLQNNVRLPNVAFIILYEILHSHSFLMLQKFKTKGYQ